MTKTISSDKSPWLLILFFLLPVVILAPFCFSWFGDDDFIYMRIFSGPWSDVFHRMLSRQIFSEGMDPHFRPLSNLFFAVFLRSGSAALCHFVSVTVHFFTGVGVYFLLKKALPYSALSRAGYLLFMINPIILTALFWFTALQDLLTTMFSVWAAYIFLRSGINTERHLGEYICTILLFALALLSKEMSLTLPAILAVASFLRGSIKRDWKLLGILFAMSIAFFILRAMLLGHLLMGTLDNFYFKFDTHIVVVAAKNLIALIVPTPVQLNYRYPLLYLSVTPLLTLLLFYLMRNSLRMAFRTGIVICILFIIAFAPTIGIFSMWRLYYPSVLFVILLVFLLSKASFPGKKLLVYGYMVGMTVLLVIGGRQFIQGGRFEKALLKQVAALPDTSIFLVNVPAAFASHVPLIAANDEFEYALKRFFNVQKSVQLVGTSSVDRLSASFILQKIRVDTTSISLYPRRYNYYNKAIDEPERRIIERIDSGPYVYGKPTSMKVVVHDHSAMAYVLKNLD